MFDNVLKGIGKIAPGMCRMSIKGAIAVKTSNGYKTYNMKTGRLTNCANFVLDIGQDMFMAMPTMKVKAGDIILVQGKPKCVVKTEDNILTCVNYEDGTVENVLPERHIFLGKAYMYAKIVSLFSNMLKGKDTADRMMRLMCMSQFFGGGGNNGGEANSMSNLLMLSMLGGNAGNMFEGICDFAEDTEDEPTEEEED